MNHWTSLLSIVGGTQTHSSINVLQLVKAATLTSLFLHFCHPLCFDSFWSTLSMVTVKREKKAPQSTVFLLKREISHWVFNHTTETKLNASSLCLQLSRSNYAMTNVHLLRESLSQKHAVWRGWPHAALNKELFSHNTDTSKMQCIHNVL